MKFFRIFVLRETQQVLHVIEQDRPFETRGLIEDSRGPMDAIDIGAAEPCAWTVHDSAGGEPEPCSPAHHVYTRIGEDPKSPGSGLTLEQARQVLAEHPEMPRFHAVPCTIEGLKQHIRERGHAEISVKVRAWLAITLPAHHVAAMRLGSIPISALKAIESMRFASDPRSGSRLEHYERIAQQKSDERAAAHLARRNAKE